MRRSAPNTLQRFGYALNTKPAAMIVIASGKRIGPSKAVDWSPSVQSQLPVAVGSRALTPHGLDQQSTEGARTPCKAQNQAAGRVLRQPSTAPATRFIPLRQGQQPVLGHRAACSAEREAPLESLELNQLRVYPRRGLTPRSS
jgi:hypothetical protein